MRWAKQLSLQLLRRGSIKWWTKINTCQYLALHLRKLTEQQKIEKSDYVVPTKILAIDPSTCVLDGQDSLNEQNF